MAQPEASWRVDGESIVLPDGTQVVPELRVPGSFNVSNARLCTGGAVELGVGVPEALRGMRTVTSPAGRFATATLHGTSVRLLLAKNPAGWAGARYRWRRSDQVLLAIDSVAADGKDVSWLWDVDFEQLQGREVFATGPRAQDLAVRLAYAEVQHRVIPDLAARWPLPVPVQTSTPTPGSPAAPLDLIATYTPFQAAQMAGLR